MIARTTVTAEHVGTRVGLLRRGTTAPVSVFPPLFLRLRLVGRIHEERKLLLQTRIDWLALECENTEHALVHTSERLPLHEPLEALDPEGELAQGQRALSR